MTPRAADGSTVRVDAVKYQAAEDLFVFNDTIDGPEGLGQSGLVAAQTPTVANTAIEIAANRALTSLFLLDLTQEPILDSESHPNLQRSLRMFRLHFVDLIISCICSDSILLIQSSSVFAGMRSDSRTRPTAADLYGPFVEER
jgi:hypothetical protein